MSDQDELLAHLHDQVATLSKPGRRLPDRVILIVGGVFLPLGFGLILIGWYGSAQTTLEFEQTPYLISGGLLGLALAITGGLLYFSYWLTQLVRDGRAAATRTEQHQSRLESLLTQLVHDLASSTTSEALVVTPGGSMLHRPGCAATEGQKVRNAGSAKLGFTLCGLCRPEAPGQREPVIRKPVVARQRRG